MVPNGIRGTNNDNRKMSINNNDHREPINNADRGH
jgi:hypothetical protein